MTYDHLVGPALVLLKKELPLTIRLMVILTTPALLPSRSLPLLCHVTCVRQGLRISNLEGIGGTRPSPDQHTVEEYFSKGGVESAWSKGEDFSIKGDGKTANGERIALGRGEGKSAGGAGGILQLFAKQGVGSEQGKVELLEEMGFVNEDAKAALRVAGGCP